MHASPPRVKNQHYVPRSYLARFSIRGQLQVFDKIEKRQFPANVKNCSSERGFYDNAELDAIAGHSQSLERFFHCFESSGSKVIGEVLKSIRMGSFSALLGLARIDLALYIAIQHLRTKRARADAGDVMQADTKQQFIGHLRRTQPNFPIEESYLEIKADDRARFGAQLHLVANEEVRVSMSAVFLNRYWWFLRNRSSHSFYTSDHPIVEHGLTTPEARSLASDLALQAASKSGIRGIFRKLLPALLRNVFALGPIAAFPLAPDVVLVMLDRSKYRNGASLDGHLHDMTNPADVSFYNGLQALQSHRQVYSRDADFELVREILASA
jgi:hypothetical protein